MEKNINNKDEIIKNKIYIKEIDDPLTVQIFRHSLTNAIYGVTGVPPKKKTLNISREGRKK